jgi:hypothetical protein
VTPQRRTSEPPKRKIAKKNAKARFLENAGCFARARGRREKEWSRGKGYSPSLSPLSLFTEITLGESGLNALRRHVPFLALSTKTLARSTALRLCLPGCPGPLGARLFVYKEEIDNPARRWARVRAGGGGPGASADSVDFPAAALRLARHRCREPLPRHPLAHARRAERALRYSSITLCLASPPCCCQKTDPTLILRTLGLVLVNTKQKNAKNARDDVQTPTQKPDF